ncbi:helix-turn-helix domain-containing protein [Deinococcus ruber]|uniref:Helix-turn-helix domain-containing protein n=1 Tax=Deinococcus ruber TaxID=1848197 RepID=A0A918BV22_9DEIO|nr:helix-turn-helix domain-containing protein [Deinococcus ruber]GGQ93564.1 hypothetical protein GCM10008957_02000 [Deinococcus ruber]
MTPDDKQDEVLTLEELAALLKVSETTAYSLVRGGELPGRKVGREWRFLKTRVFEWLAQAGTGDEMQGTNGVVQRDEQGGEFKIEDNREYVAMWLPMTRTEKSAQLQKAARDGVNVSELVAEYLRAWSKE